MLHQRICIDDWGDVVVETYDKSYSSDNHNCSSLGHMAGLQKDASVSDSRHSLDCNDKE